MSQSAPTPSSAVSAARSAATPRTLDSSELLAGASMVAIAHAGQRYLLRVTRENKLILTK